jgi:hypothetical protein
MRDPLALLASPDARTCLLVAAPFLALWVLRSIYLSIDLIIARLFPHLAWEKQLGWLNLRAHRRAEAALRGLRHFLHAALAVALYGIIWSASGLHLFSTDPAEFLDSITKVSVLLFCLGFWAVYFGADLIPRLRRRRELESLQQFRAGETDATGAASHPSPRLGRAPLLDAKPSVRRRATR